MGITKNVQSLREIELIDCQVIAFELKKRVEPIRPKLGLKNESSTRFKVNKVISKFTVNHSPLKLYVSKKPGCIPYFDFRPSDLRIKAVKIFFSPHVVNMGRKHGS